MIFDLALVLLFLKLLSKFFDINNIYANNNSITTFVICLKVFNSFFNFSSNLFQNISRLGINYFEFFSIIIIQNF